MNHNTMPITNPTLDDRLRWICNTSAQDGAAEIKRLLKNPQLPRQDLRALLITARDKELDGSNRKSLLAAIEAAVNRLDKATLAEKKAQQLPDDPAAEPDSSSALATFVSGPQFPLPVITWDTVRAGIDQVKAIGKTYLMGQCWIGWQLTHLKKEHQANGGGRGGDRVSMGQVGPLVAWDVLVEQETGLPRRTADRFIKLFEAALAKLKRTKGALIGKATLLAFERESPLAVIDDEANELREIIASLCDGETQGSLMQELGIIPTRVMPQGGGKPKNPDEQPTAGQLAFAFFETMLAPIVNTRCSPDYKKLLHVLPAYSTKDSPVSLDAIATECRAILADIAEVQAAQAKPARGRTL
jgi:hypothetical protein